MEWDSLHRLTLAMNLLNYLAECDLDENVIEDFNDTLTKAHNIIGKISTSDGSKLPTEQDVHSCYQILFTLGAVLNNVLAKCLEIISGTQPAPRSSDVIKHYNLFYQCLFAGYIKPLNQIISFHEHRL